MTQPDTHEAKARGDLHRQLQAFPHRPADGIQGDCFRTAIACALGVERDSVPHSHEEQTGEENAAFMDAWLRPRGLRRIVMPVLGSDFKEVANSLYPRGGGLPLIITGQGPRSVNHVIVVHGIDDFWCPTLGVVSAEVALIGPALDGSGGPEQYFWVEWIVADPSALREADAAAAARTKREDAEIAQAYFTHKTVIKNKKGKPYPSGEAAIYASKRIAAAILASMEKPNAE